MVKGKPWTREEEQKLRSMLVKKESAEAIGLALGKSKGAIYAKMDELGLKVEVTDSHKLVATTSIALPKELLSVEEALKKLAAALEMASRPGLSKVEVQRLQVVATIARTYKDFLADYLDYRGVEAELIELRKEYQQLAKGAENSKAA